MRYIDNFEANIFNAICHIEGYNNDDGNWKRKVSNLLSYVISIVLVGVFGIIIPILLTGGVLNLPMAIFYIIIIYSLIRLSQTIVKGKLNLLEMTFYIFVFLFMGIAPMVQTSSGIFPWEASNNIESIAVAGITVLIGIVFYDIGIVISRNRIVETDLEQKIRFKSMILFSLVCLIVGLVGVGNLNTPRPMDPSIYLIYSSLIRAPIFIALVIALLKLINRNRKKMSIRGNFYLLMFIIIVLLPLNILVSNPLYNSRYWFGTVFLGTIFVLLKWNRNTISFVVITFLIGFLVVFPYADVFRHSDTFVIKTSDFSSNLVGGDFDAFQQIINVQEYTYIYGFAYGEQLLGAALFWVPRSVWPDKPIGTGAMVSEGLGYNFTNVSSPLWAEFFINFGFIGIIVLFLLYGFISGVLQKGFIATRGETNFYQVFVPIFSVYQIFMLRGDLLSSIAYFLPVLLSIYVGVRWNVLKKQKKHILQ